MSTSTFATLVTLALATATHAGTHVWSGAGANTLWSNAGNWSSGGVPSAAEAAPVKLVFPANATGFTSALNINNLKIDSIEIDVGTNRAYNFPNAGIPVTITGAAGDNFVVNGTPGNGTSGSVVWQPALNLQATSRFKVAYNPVSLDIQGVVSGNGGLTFSGGGNLFFSTSSVANTFTGILRQESGLITLKKAAGTPCFGGNLEIAGGALVTELSNQIPDTAAIHLSGNAQLRVTRQSPTLSTEKIGPLTVAGTATVWATQDNTLILGGNVTCENTALPNLSLTADAAAQITFGGASRTFAIPHASAKVTVQGLLADGGAAAGITQTGAGQLILVNDNNLSGPFSIQGGKLEIRDAGALGTTAGATTIASGAILYVNQAMTLPAGEAISLAGTLNSGVNAEIQGAVTLSGTPLFSASLGKVLKLSGVIQGSPATTSIGGAGTVEYAGSASNTYTGVTTTTYGGVTLALNKSAGLAVNGSIHLNPGTVKCLQSNQISDSADLNFVNGGVFDLNGMTETVAHVYGTNSPVIKLGDGSLSMTGNDSHQFGGNSTGQMARIHGSSAAALRKKGSGTWTLYHQSTPALGAQDTTLYLHTGELSLHGGWLSPIRVVGGTLSGSAETGALTAAGGNINIENLKSTAFSSTGLGGTMNFAINGAAPVTGFGRIEVDGPIDLTGLSLQTSLNFLPMTSASFTLFENFGGTPVTGTFSGLPEGANLIIGGHPFKITYQGGTSGNDVVLRFQGTGTPGPEITAITPQPDGKVKIDIHWAPGATLGLRHNPTLQPADWQIKGFITMDANGNGSFLHNTFGAPKGFYNLVAEE